MTDENCSTPDQRQSALMSSAGLPPAGRRPQRVSAPACTQPAPLLHKNRYFTAPAGSTHQRRGRHAIIRKRNTGANRQAKTPRKEPCAAAAAVHCLLTGVVLPRADLPGPKKAAANNQGGCTLCCCKAAVAAGAAARRDGAGGKLSPPPGRRTTPHGAAATRRAKLPRTRPVPGCLLRRRRRQAADVARRGRRALPGLPMPWGWSSPPCRA